MKKIVKRVKAVWNKMVQKTPVFYHFIVVVSIIIWLYVNSPDRNNLRFVEIYKNVPELFEDILDYMDLGGEESESVSVSY